MSESLAAYVAMRKLDPDETMNLLQEFGVISDNAVSVADVGNGGEAIAWLEKREREAAVAREWAF